MRERRQGCVWAFFTLAPMGGASVLFLSLSLAALGLVFIWGCAVGVGRDSAQGRRVVRRDCALERWEAHRKRACRLLGEAPRLRPRLLRTGAQGGLGAGMPLKEDWVRATLGRLTDYPKVALACLVSLVTLALFGFPGHLIIEWFPWSPYRCLVSLVTLALYGFPCHLSIVRFPLSP